jgi:hypothetical protein
MVDFAKYINSEFKGVPSDCYFIPPARQPFSAVFVDRRPKRLTSAAKGLPTAQREGDAGGFGVLK